MPRGHVFLLYFVLFPSRYRVGKISIARISFVKKANTICKSPATKTMFREPQNPKALCLKGKSHYESPIRVNIHEVFENLLNVNLLDIGPLLLYLADDDDQNTILELGGNAISVNLSIVTELDFTLKQADLSLS
jgi:hypothetical protein